MLIALNCSLQSFFARPTPLGRGAVIRAASDAGLTVVWDPQTQSFLGTVAGTKRTAFLYDVQVEHKHYATLVIES